MSRLAGLVLFALLALGGACLGPLPLDDYTYACSSDLDCVSPNVCIRGTCGRVGECAAADDCGSEACCDTASSPGRCVREDQACGTGVCSRSTRTCR